jgi:hypothetical protein
MPDNDLQPSTDGTPTIGTVLTLIQNGARDFEQTFTDRGEDGTIDDLRQDADSFMLSLFTRIDKLFPADVHRRLGYSDHMGDIRQRLGRLSGMSRRPINYRLDSILDALIHESRMLVEAQSTFCEYCEHCLREHPEQRRYETTTDDTLSAEDFALAIESLTDETGGVEAIALIVRHLESLAWVSRPNAVKDAVSQILDALADSKRNPHNERKQLLDGGRELLQRLAHYKANPEG